MLCGCRLLFMLRAVLYILRTWALWHGNRMVLYGLCGFFFLIAIPGWYFTGVFIAGIKRTRLLLSLARS